MNDYAFEISAIESIDMPDSVIRIGEYVFASCYKLQSVKLSENLSVIDKFTFSDCPALKTINIPKSITSINDYAFYSCNSLTSITFLSSTPPSMNGDKIFKNTLKNIYVPKGASSAYESLKGKHGISADVVISEI
ncbi:leucine-rich repeat domain-containing protein [Brachyspira intermedia]|uniref:leucine-rich repeat domain-containing protein n=1 Tax=Brachyspira intermedia TaxID=84377 RepID=UPI003004CDDD